MKNMHRLPRFSTTVLHLQHDHLHLEIAPDIGGSIARFYSDHGGQRLHWLRPATDDALQRRDPLGLGSFPLLPWCNRIRNGLSLFGARPVRLLPNFGDSPHTIHGTGWQRPWKVKQASETEAVLVQRHQPAESAELEGDWPYAFEAEQRLLLCDRGLAVELRITNLAEDPMPTGVGHHPYFPHTPGTRLTVQVGAMWASDADLLPIGLAMPPFLSRLAQGIELAELDLDNNFVGWSHEARVDWPAEQRALLMRAQAPLDYFVLYCPKGRDHFVMEPVSNCTDWMNLAAKGEKRAGGTLLPPGETLVGRFELLPQLPATLRA